VRFYLEGDMGTPPIICSAGVIGDPVAHSRSPAMHNAAFAALGIAAQYHRWHTPVADLPARIASLREETMLGANVTLPHKVAILDLVDVLDPAVQLIGAANTIIRLPDSRLLAINTDAPAVTATLREDAGYHPEGTIITILGASGAARAAAYALVEAGAAQIRVINRTLERAEALLADLILATDTEIPMIACAHDDPGVAGLLADCDLIVNATSIGWHAEEIPIDSQLIPPTALVFDMVYKPTRLLRETARRGSSVLGGKGMLVRQAGLAFERWTGKPAPIARMMEAFDNDKR
jgi:shikimate dehydrogenase